MRKTFTIVGVALAVILILLAIAGFTPAREIILRAGAGALVWLGLGLGLGVILLVLKGIGWLIKRPFQSNRKGEEREEA